MRRINEKRLNVHNRLGVGKIYEINMSIISAVHRLCVIGLPRGAAEKFDSKQVIGLVFFF